MTKNEQNIENVNLKRKLNFLKPFQEENKSENFNILVETLFQREDEARLKR